MTIVGNVEHVLTMKTGLEGATDASYTSDNTSIVQITSQDVWNLDGVPMAIIKGVKEGTTAITASITTPSGKKTLSIPIQVVPYENPLKTFKIGSTNLASKYAKSMTAAYAGKKGKQKISFSTVSGWTATVSYGYWDNQKFQQSVVKSGSKVNLDTVISKCYGIMTILLKNTSSGLQIEDTLYLTDKDVSYPSIPDLPRDKTTTTPAKKKSLKVSPSSLTIYEGETATISATATPKATIKFTSNKPKTASVTSNGTVKGLKKGTAKITVEANGIKKTVSVTVKSLPKIYKTSKTNLNKLFQGKGDWKSFAKFKNGLNQSASIQIPGLDNPDCVPQGCCAAGDYILVSAYFEGKNSLIYVIDQNSNSENTKVLATIAPKGDYKDACYDMLSHVGGLVYNAEQQVVYIADSNSKIINNKSSKAVWGLKMSDIEAAVKSSKQPYSVSVTWMAADEDISPSSVTYYKGYAYTCQFATKNKDDEYPGESTIMIYKVGEKGGFSEVGTYNLKEFNVQGLAFTNYNGADYLLFTASYGRDNPSKLYIKKVTFSKDGKIKSMKDTSSSPMTLPNMAENVCIDGGKIYFIFESAANEYIKGKKTMPLGYILQGKIEYYLK